MPPHRTLSAYASPNRRRSRIPTERPVQVDIEADVEESEQSAEEEIEPGESVDEAAGELVPVTRVELGPDQQLLDLHDAQAIALADNPGLQAAAERIEQAKQRVRQARAQWFPFVNASASATKTYLSERDYSAAKQAASEPFVSAFVSSTQARWSGGIRSYFAWVGGILSGGPVSVTPVPVGTGLLGLTQDATVFGLQGARARSQVDDSVERTGASIVASWIVFNGFDRKFSIAEAKFGKKETEASYREAQRLLLSAVAQAFYAAQLGRENIAIAEADEAFNMRQLVEAKARRQKGTGSKSDVLNFEVRVNGARAALIRSHQDYHTALIALAELLAFPGAEFPDDYVLAELASESLMDLEPPSGPAMVDLALLNRPDLQQTEFQVQRTNASVGRRRAPFYPTVTAFAAKDAIREDDIKFREDDFSTSIGLDVSYNIFAGGGNVARLHEAKSQRREAERILHSTELEVSADVLQSVEDLTAAQEQLALQRANAVFVEENRNLVEKEYAAGVASLVRLNEAQRDLIAAQGDLALARVALQLVWHNLRTATAETLGDHAILDDSGYGGDDEREAVDIVDDNDDE
jgi:outer membrane protein TolC